MDELKLPELHMEWFGTWPTEFDPASLDDVVHRIEQYRFIIDRNLTRPAKWSGLISRELRRRPAPRVRRRVADAFNWLGELATQEPRLNLDIDLCLNLHDYVIDPEHDKGAKGVFRTGSVRVGQVRHFPKASDVPSLLADLFDRIEASTAPACLSAARLHLELVEVHPFRDGNGRIARLLASFVLQRAGYCSTLLTAVDQHISAASHRYIPSLRQLSDGAIDRPAWLLSAVQMMAMHSAFLVWFRLRVERLRGACANLGLSLSEQDRALIMFEFGESSTSPLWESVYHTEEPWHCLIKRMAWFERRKLAQQIRRLQREEQAESSTSLGPQSLTNRYLDSLIELQ